MKLKKYRREVALFMNRLYLRGLTTVSGGNISLFAENKWVCITPSATDKANIHEKQICVFTLNGKKIKELGKASIETSMHMAIYRHNPNVLAIIHAHPVFASCFAAMNKTLNGKLIAEARAIIGEPAYVPYAPMGSEELAGLVAQASRQSGVLILRNHGVLATGKSLLQAFDRVEVLENAAKMSFITETLNDKRELTSDQLSQIDLWVKSL